ncbi:flagellar biosynthesis anti-sigma factor FlgM [Imhoffiella purpurea]|uniref:Negative regulator of flagellin synthesis n=1 Tax=Imhoffiella purpurea TaxID=1249627 RepID=W9VBV3_9GAMM|nr:flagellar biosynthesis anti-sigma factor FlgM [Imhoffiella purpurea]EXJ16899.1 hypothetical protein D779_2510 [Imhoffiella purpurea]
MDIKNLAGSARLPEATSTGTGARVGSKDSKHSDAIGNPSSESLTFTQTTQMLNAAKEDASTVPYDSDRVERIKAAIDEGRYEIDDRKVAEGMLAFEESLVTG